MQSCFLDSLLVLVFVCILVFEACLLDTQTYEDSDEQAGDLSGRDGVYPPN
jgi:hypothetical protein